MATGPSPSAAGRQLISRAGLSKGLLNRFLSVAVRLVSSRLQSKAGTWLVHIQFCDLMGLWETLVYGCS